MPPKTDYTKEQAKLVRDIKKTQQEINKLDKEGSADDEIQLSIIKEKEKKLRDLQKIYKDNAKIIKNSLEDFEDIDDTLTSIGNTYKKNSKALDAQQKTLEAAKLVTKAISMELIEGGAANEKTQKQIDLATKAYKSMHISIANINKEYSQGKISDAQRIDQIKKQSEAFQDVAKSIDMSNVTSDELKGVIKGMTKEAHSFAEGMEKAEMDTEKLDQVFESFEGIPALSQINKLLKTNINDTVAFKAAVFALGAALGAAAMDYFGAPMKAALQANKEREQNEIDTVRDVAKLRKDAEFIPAKIGQERLENEVEKTNQINELMHEAAYASQKAGIQFSASMQQGAAAFEAASKTALFGKNIGSIGYGAAQMQLAGISADKVASAMEAASAATGKMPTAKAAADMAIMAERTGTSSDDIANINESFQRLDKVSAGVAMNLQEGMRNMADQAGIGLGKLMKEVAQASKDALGYQIKSGPALAKQVAYAQSLGVNFGDIAKAGKNMVMNYKDSIKAEMQLSSMLGEQVDLSEARAKFAAGDTEGGLASIKAQGLDPADMDMFQQQALQDALGGLDLNSISKVTNNTGANVGNLKQGNAKKGNKDFLGAKQAAEATLSAKQASISAKTAVVDAKLSKQIADAYLASPEYAKYKKEQNEAAIAARELDSAMTDAWKATDAYKKSISDTAKLDFRDTIKEGLLKGLGAIGGGLITTSLLGGKGGNMMGMMGGMLKGKGGKGGGGGNTENPMNAVGGAMKGANPIGKKGGSIGSGLADFGKGLGTLIKEVGTGAGKAIEGLLTGIANGLAAFGSAAPEIALGGTALAAVIIQVGAALAGASWLMGKALPTLSEGLMGFNKVNGGNLSLVGVGLTGLSIGLAAMAAASIGSAISSIVDGIVSMFGGETPFDKVEKFSKLKIDAKQVKQNSQAIVYYSAAMAALGAGSALGGLGRMVGAVADGIAGFFEKKPPMEKMREFANYSFNAARVKENAEAVTAYSKAMAALGAGSAVSGLGAAAGAIGNAVAKFFGSKPPLDKMQEFAAMDIGNVDNLEKNAKAFTVFGEAMSSYKGTGEGMWGKLGTAIADFFGAKTEIQKMKEFATADLGDTSKLEGNAKAFTLFGNAMASYKGTGESMWSQLGQSIASFFGGETPLQKMRAFQAENFDPVQTGKNAEAFVLFGNAMKSYSGTGTGFWKGLGEGILSFFGGGDGDLIAKFREFAALDSAGMKGSAEAVGAFNSNLSNFNIDNAQKAAQAVEDAGIKVQTGLGKGIGSAFSGDKSPISQALIDFTDAASPVLGIASGIDTFSISIENLSSALERLASVNTKAINDIPWLKMTAFGASGGKITLAQSANNSFNIAQDSAKNIEKLAKDSNSNLQVSKNLQALMAVLADNGNAAFQLSIDGRQVTEMIKKRADDRKAQNKE
jgi:hypothetical protein